MTEIIPSIIPQDLKILNEKLVKVLGLANKVQIDIIDGKYAPVTTWPLTEEGAQEFLKMVREEEKFPFIGDFKIEADLLVLHPIEYLPDLISIGVRSFVIHVDSTDHISLCIETIKNAGREVGLGIKPSVDVDLLQPFLFQIDFVQFMGNDIVGHQGIDMDESVIRKIKYFHENHPSIEIQIDIGVSEETIPKLKKVGVTRFISGSAIFNSPNPRETIKKLQSL